jgi:hypothetical protein
MQDAIINVRQRLPATLLKLPHLLTKRKADHSSVLVVLCGIDHAGRDAPDRHVAVAILHLVEHGVIATGLIGNRILPRDLRRRFDGPDSACLAAFGHDRLLAAAVLAPRLG